MAIKYNQNTLSLIESIYKHNKYVIRYEKGSFQSGYCILQEKLVVVINKFFDVEARINALVDIFHQIDLSKDDLDEKQLAMFDELAQQKLDLQ